MFRKITVAAISALALAGAAIGIATSSANATTPVAEFQLYANGSSTATSTGSAVVLTAGSTAGDSAQVQVVNAASLPTPTTAPAFTSSPAASAGDPRWVIEFHNGQILNGDTVNGWNCPLASVNSTTYAAALAACQAGGLDDQVTAAFIVADSGNAGIAYTLTGVSYDGTTFIAPKVAFALPTGLTGSGTASSVTIKWTGVPGFDASTGDLYDVQFENAHTGQILQHVWTPGTTLTFGGLAPVTHYGWRIFAIAGPGDTAHTSGTVWSGWQSVFTS